MVTPWVTVKNQTGPNSSATQQNTRQAHWRRANPVTYDAHLAVQRAVKAGNLAKQTCEVCGAEGVDAHHDQYDEPLVVRWLCRLHYTRLHHHGTDRVGFLQPHCGVHPISPGKSARLI
nr:hypothetical protein [Agrobacterium pusense]